MSAEFAAEVIADLIERHRDDSFVIDDPLEDVRTGGFFFEIEVKAKRYEVLVVEVTR